MRIPRLVLLSALASISFVGLLASPSSADAPATDPSAVESGGPFTRFAWTLPCRVPVHERTQKDGHEAVMDYAIDLRPDPQSQQSELNLRLLDFAFVSVDGQDATTPQMRETLRPLLAITSAVPTTVISADGHFLRITGLDAMIDSLNRLRGGTPEEIERTRRAMNSPTVRIALEQSMSVYWRTWVETWIDFDLSIAPGETLEDDVAVELAGGTHGTMHVITTRLSDTARGIVIRNSTSVDEAAFIRSIRPFMASLLAGTGSTVPEGIDVRRASNSIFMEVETDPATLRPFRTHYEKRFSLEFADGSSSGRDEVRELTWDWSHAVGCGRP